MDKQQIQVLINGHKEALIDLTFAVLALQKEPFNHRFSIQVLESNIIHRKDIIKSLQNQLKYL